MNLAIVGSQSITRRQGETAWFIIEGLITVFRPSVVISGGATGVDSVAEAVARSLKYPRELPGHAFEDRALWIYEPEVNQWNPIGQYGFKARNADIAKGCDVLWRISKKDGQTTYGSGWTADEAERLGKDVHRIYI